MFGLISMSGETVSITERAQKILVPVLPSDSNDAKIEAFLAVELFRRVYDDFYGKKLPPKVGTKNLFENTYKITPDKIQTALRAFYDSAEFAGFFPDNGKTRLIKPITAVEPGTLEPKDAVDDDPGTDPPADPPPDKRKHGGSGSGEGPPPGIHTAIVGLLRELPPAGSDWPATKKERFMQAFRATIDFIYPEQEELQ